MAISDRIVIMNAGQIEQIGSAEDLYLKPRSAFVASFLGEANLLDVDVVDAGMDRLTLSFQGHRWDVATSSRVPIGSRVQAVVRPEALRISAEGSGTVQGQVVSSTYLGASIRYQISVGPRHLQVLQSDPLIGERYPPGTAVGLILPHRKIQLLGDRVVTL